jgi:hypothetical protein
MPLGAARLNGLGRYIVSGESVLFFEGEDREIIALDTASGSGNFSANIPQDVQSNDYILVFCAARDDRTVTYPSGWTEIVDDKFNSGLNGASAAYKISDGTEGGTSITIIPNSTGGYYSVCLILRTYNTSFSSGASFDTSGNNNSPNTASVSANTNQIVFSYVGFRNLSNNTTVSSIPSNFTEIHSGNSNGAGVLLAARIANSNTNYDPTSWSLNGSFPYWAGWTLSF